MSRGSESATKWNSSGVMLWQQLAAIARAFRWAFILKNSRYSRQSAKPPYTDKEEQGEGEGGRERQRGEGTGARRERDKNRMKGR